MKSFLLLFFALFLFSCEKSDSLDSSSGSSKSGSTASMIIYQGYMYVLDNDAIRVMTLADPKNPTIVTKLSIGPGNETLFAYKTHLFVGNNSGMKVVDITDPTHPILVVDIPQFQSHDPIVVRNDTAFQTRHWGEEDGSHGGTLLIYDVTEPSNPWQIGNLNLEFPLGLDYKDDILFVCNGRFGLDILSLKITDRPELINTITSVNVRDCIVLDNRLVCQSGSGLIIFDITAAEKPILLKKID